jgi:hypothetical protein
MLKKEYYYSIKHFNHFSIRKIEGDIKMKRLFTIVLALMVVLGTAVSGFAYDSLSAESDILKANNGKPINLIVDSGGEWLVPNAGVTIIKGNDSQAHVDLSNGVSGNISADDPSITFSKDSWFIESYGSYDTFSVSGIAPVNLSNVNKTFSYRVTLACTSKDDLTGLQNNFTDFFIIHVTVKPSYTAPGNPQDPVIKDTTAPIIALAGSPDITVEAGTAYIDQGAAATDDIDGDITDRIVVSNPVDTFKLGLYTITYDVTDAAGNKASQAVRNVTVVDTTPPVISAPSDIETVLSGALTPVDIGSAEATDLFLKDVTNNAPQGGFKIGTTVVIWTATDTSGNIAAATQNVTVKYAFSGFLPPVNNDGSGVYKSGSTIPVKFNLKDSSGGFVSTAAATLSYAKLTNNKPGNHVAAVSTSNATTGNAFRCDSNQYIFNMNTKGLSVGSYLLTVSLDDGMTYSVKVTLK